jgi:hypothetical protein
MRIAMWSGPRNISTALLRSWGNRQDTYVTDEPLYAYYLNRTGLAHPGAEEVIASQPTDWQTVAAWLTGPIPEGRSLWYQKHMAHHLLPEVGREWLRDLTHCFLIREPEEMLTSLLHVLPEPTLADTGLPQQVELFDWVRETTGVMPPVMDSREVLENPRGQLEALCERLRVPFTDAMLHWPPGRRATDGVWAKHWYASVERSTGFEVYRRKGEVVPEPFKELLAECQRLYERLWAHRLTA